MSTKSFSLVSAIRTTTDGQSESLIFDSGVNVIVGEPNTGKTRWLETIDFILGDDGKAEEKLGDVIFDKYASAGVTLRIGTDELTAVRRWREPGVKTKVFVDGTPLDIPEWRQVLLERTGIPSLHYPQGSPFSTRTWPELGWRSLMRHFYRRQRFWSDLADGQPPSEQHACILQFVGIAERLFSDEYGRLVQKQKEIADLQARREQFIDTLNEVSRELVSEDELGVAVTPEAISRATTRLRSEIDRLNTKRQEVIATAVDAARNANGTLAPDAISEMTAEFARLKESEKTFAEELERLNQRLAEVEEFQTSVTAEVARLERARTAGDILAQLKVTHCPACDQQVSRPPVTNSQCYLCGQTTISGPASASEPLKRLEFELNQLDGERKENDELLASLSNLIHVAEESIQDVRNRSGRLNEQLKPVRVATAPFMPPEVAAIDNEIGRRVERLDQLRRVKESLSRRERLVNEIAGIQSQVEELMATVDQQTVTIDFESASDAISDAMNDYVAQLRFGEDQMWSQRDIHFSVKKDSFNVRVGRQRWSSQLGGTMVIYFLLAYHYALLVLSAKAGTRVPGFLMLDFPAEIEGKKVADHENFVMEPFIALSQKEGFEEMQVIAAGSAFLGLSGVKRIEFTKVWAG